ncbi:hypothetical protein [Nocardioides panaciterrulae]|uniref:Uncharacterized protein n=1 Tax=Nocardioides panaciterrulae TaxID=661492 RepID=A0A7Y9EAB1_9ACTN|nr:hypothetical protein [Nocardioides panaciterrulae]NYD43907.1 hypothetical protein [Nocardioides panaciterrulae]
MKRRPRPKAVLLVALLVVMINLPWAHSALQRWELGHRGTDLTVPLVASRVIGSGADAQHYISFSYPERIDPQHGTWLALVDGAAYDAALARHRVEVRVLPGHPSVYTVQGQVRSHAGLVITVGLDLLLVLLVWLFWRFRSRLRPRLRAVAVADVAPGEPGGLLDRLEDGAYLIRGQITQIDGDELLLDLGDRLVVVALDGHANPVGHREVAEVRGLLVG